MQMINAKTLLCDVAVPLLVVVDAASASAAGAVTSLLGVLDASRYFSVSFQRL